MVDTPVSGVFAIVRTAKGLRDVRIGTIKGSHEGRLGKGIPVYRSVKAAVVTSQTRGVWRGERKGCSETADPSEGTKCGQWPPNCPRHTIKEARWGAGGRGVSCQDRLNSRLTRAIRPLQRDARRSGWDRRPS